MRDVNIDSALPSNRYVDFIKKGAEETNLGKQERMVKRIADRLKREYDEEVLPLALADILTEIVQKPDVKTAQYALRLLKHMGIQDNVFVNTGARELERIISPPPPVIDRPRQ